MPIPQRPLATRRPGHSVPHKPKSTLQPTSTNTLDWRAEVAFLDSYANSRKARSVPSAGVAIMDAATRQRERVASATAAEGLQSGREVGLEELINDGKAKREKRATTAATLGFDFIHTPSVLVLPDTPSSFKSLNAPTPKLGLSLSTASPLGTTPQTPGLVPSSAVNIPFSLSTSVSTVSRRMISDADEDSDLDEWEHVDMATVVDTEEGEEFILGELELELDDRDELMGMDMVEKREAVGMRRVDGLSYAAALGPRS